MVTAPKSKYTWGRRQERTVSELEQLCSDAFKELKIPPHWKFESKDRCRLTEDETSEIQSVGVWFLDTHTRGINLKRYRIAFHSYSERLSITEKTIVDYGKYKQHCLASNCTTQKMQEVITRLSDTATTGTETTNDGDDGLQHIRDRLANMGAAPTAPGNTPGL